MLLKTIILSAVFLSNISIAEKRGDFFKNRVTSSDREAKLKEIDEPIKLEEVKKPLPDTEEAKEVKRDKSNKPLEQPKQEIEETIVKQGRYFGQNFYDVNPGEVYIPNEMNTHLPEFLYRQNYEDLFFDNIKDEDIGVQNTLLDILQTTEIRNKDGDTPLIYASRLGKLSSVRFLLVNNANICARNYAGYTAYQLAKTDEIKNAITTMIFE